MTTPAPATCPACGSPAAGRFCSNCGASLLPRQCEGCQTELSPQARFCHRCGRPVGGAAAGAPAGRAGSERTAWLFAGLLSLGLVGFIVYRVAADKPAPEIPAMANAGSAGGLDGPAAAGQAPPDISQMTPRERFDRLFNRIMTAAEQRDSAQVRRFTPMALGAYAQLDQFDADARYHAAVLHLQAGDTRPALALADTILAQTPGHLFGYVIRGTAAEIAKDQRGLAAARRDFTRAFPAESASARPEYRDHAPVIEEFRRESGP
jgi:hypothetical protein